MYDYMSKQCGPEGLWLREEMGHDRVNYIHFGNQNFHIILTCWIQFDFGIITLSTAFSLRYL